MKLLVTAKSLGKKRPVLDNYPIELNLESDSTTRVLIEKLVLRQVEDHNQRKSESTMIDFLTELALSEEVVKGSVKFNEQYNQKLANSQRALETVIQAFEDGLIAFFLRDVQLEDLDEVVHVNDGDSITIIRLTFLAGSSW